MPGTVDFQIKSKIIFINVHFKYLDTVCTNYACM